ncbi:MAG TPA: peptide chain release factor N(5)-glutamine methyltransferase [Selenomonadales bacterium]|nr:peptide chain release factor N(5)-glutamine methyltransferase [Selenomonadales bacterium]
MAMSEKQWTIGAILTWTKQYFGEKGVDNPRLDAEVLLSHILGRDRLYLYVNFEQPLEPAELAAFREAVKKRARRVPVAYITGNREFMGLRFEVSPAVLIPRPDTEILAEAAGKRLKAMTRPVILDIGTGSGAIIISLLHQVPEARGVAVDVSADALAMAKENAVKLGVAGRVEFRQGDLLAPVAGQKFAAIVSNPPYIPEAELGGLAPELAHEPRLALAGGRDGLDFYRRIVAGAGGHLAAGGFVALEVGAGQARAVGDLANPDSGLRPAEIVKDYAGIDRVVILERRQ